MQLAQKLPLFCQREIRKLSLFPTKKVLYSFQSPPFRSVKPFFIFLSVQFVSWQHFHLLQVFSGWRFQLPLTLYSCLSSSASSRNVFTLALPWLKCSHNRRTDGAYPFILQNHSTEVFFSTICLHCTFVSVFLPLETF